MKAKGFEHGTPNFDVDFGAAASDINHLAKEIRMERVCTVDFARDLYGPWLVMTPDVQGELFVDQDRFVFFRPASGLGYGVGKMEVYPGEGEVGTLFTLQLETYTYGKTEALSPQFGLEMSVTGTVERASSVSSDYHTFSLSGVFSVKDRNRSLTSSTGTRASSAAEGESAAAGDDGDSDPDTEMATVQTADGEVRTGQFNAAKLSPWDPATATPAWKPSEELQMVFQQVFPEKLHLSSHTRRAEEAEAAARAGGGNAASFQSGPYHMDLAKYAVGSIPGIYYVPDYISEAEEREILERIKATPAELKSKIKKRTVQEWGCSMCEECKQSFVSDFNMPPWVQQCTDMLVYDGLFTPSTFPNSVRVHEYEKGEGIGPHCDGPIYVPQVTVLSLAATSVMSFYPRQDPYYDHPMDHYNDTFKFDDGEIGRKKPLQTVVLEPRSLLVFSGDAYHYYPHGVSDHAVDDLSPEVAGEVVNRAFLRDKDITQVHRSYRCSLTTRNLLTRCNHQPERAEYCMKRAWYIFHQQPIPSPLFPPPSVPPSTQTTAATSPSSAAGSSPSSLFADATLSDASRGEGHSVGPLSSAQLRRWEAKLDAVFAQQSELKRSVEELKQFVMTASAAESVFRSETSTVLNHLSSTLLDLDAKVEDIAEGVVVAGERQKKE